MLDQSLLKKRLRKKFSQRITIKKREFEVVSGRKKEVLNDYYSCLSNPTELYGSELYNAINVKFKNTAVFEVRYCKKIEAMRFKEKEYSLEYKGMLFDIYQIDYLKNDEFVAVIKANRVD